MDSINPNDVRLDIKFHEDNIIKSHIIPQKIKEPQMSVGSLGNAAYGLAAFMSSCANLGAFKGDITIFLAVAVINGGLTQFICGKVFYADHQNFTQFPKKIRIPGIQKR